MSDLTLALGWAGLYAPMALGAVGSAIGCATAGQAAIGAMLDVESGFGRFLGVSALPSSQAVYGIVVMFTLTREVNAATAPGLFGIGLLAGIALMASAVRQGQVVASAIMAVKSKPEIFGLSLAPAGIVEGFSVFAFVFALVASGGIPSA